MQNTKPKKKSKHKNRKQALYIVHDIAIERKIQAGAVPIT